VCGRYNLSGRIEFEELIELLEEIRDRTWELPVKTYGEVFPGDCVPVLANNRKMEPSGFAMHWGYTLSGKSDLLINARSETAAEKPLFASGMEGKRCLIPASDYFEWEKRGKEKIRYSIAPTRPGGFYLAGIYRMEQGQPRFVILTREPAENIAFIHNRMPVILPVEAKGDWLNLNYKANEVLDSATTSVTYRKVAGDEQLRLDF